MFNRFSTVIWIGLMSIALSGPALAAKESGEAKPEAKSSASDELASAKETVKGAADVVQQLRSDPETRQTLQQAEAVFIVPDFGKAGIGIGASGGEGVLVTNNEGRWSAPAFYNIGSVSLGLQAGVEAGSIAFFLMSQEAVDEFRNKNNFSLSADAGLTVINWSARAQASGADVIAWADTEGLYGELAVRASDIFWDQEANNAYYQQTANAGDIISGRVKAPGPASQLEAEFSALESEPASQKSKPMKKSN